MRLYDVLPDLRPLEDVLPNLADRARAMGLDPTQPTRPRVFATRRLAHEVIGAHPATPEVVDFENVEVASTSFLDELLTAWPDVRAVGMNEDVAECWQLVQERRDAA